MEYFFLRGCLQEFFRRCVLPKCPKTLKIKLIESIQGQNWANSGPELGQIRVKSGLS